VGLIFAQIGISTKLLNAGLYSAVATMVILTTLATPPLLRAMLPPRERPEPPHDHDLVMDAPADE
jgi:hypothetical protein